MDKRKFKRLAANIQVRIHARKTSPETLKEIQSKISNISLGGVFIETQHPFPIGTVIEMEFSLPNSNLKTRAKGIVKWSDPTGKVRGMGIEFLQVSIEEKDRLQDYLVNRIVTEVLIPFISTSLHLEFLEWVKENQNSTFKLEEIASKLICDFEEAKRIVKDFEQKEFVKLDADTVLVRPFTSDISSAVERFFKLKQSDK